MEICDFFLVVKQLSCQERESWRELGCATCMAICVCLFLRVTWKVLCSVIQLELPRPIPWNQTSDVHRGPTFITRDVNVT